MLQSPCTGGVTKSKRVPARYSTWVSPITISVSLTIINHENETHGAYCNSLHACPEEYDDAISAWKESIALQPSSPDTHTSMCYQNCKKTAVQMQIDATSFLFVDLASAYIISPGKKAEVSSVTIS